MENRQKFIQEVGLNEIEQLNSMEKIIISNQDDENTELLMCDTSYMIFKSPEFILGRE